MCYCKHFNKVVTDPIFVLSRADIILISIADLISEPVVALAPVMQLYNAKWLAAEKSDLWSNGWQSCGLFGSKQKH